MLLSPVYSDASLRVSATTGVEVLCQVDAAENPLDGPVLEIESTDDVWDRAQATIQQSGFEVRVGGAAIDLSTFSGTISVTRTYDGPQSWSIEVTLDDPTGPFGSPFAAIGPAIGRRPVSILGVYRLPSGVVAKVPIVTDGVVDNASREANPGQYLERYSGTDRLGRFDQVPVTLVLPPGHGLPRGRILRKLAELAGETQFRIDDGSSTHKELQVVDGAWLPIAQEQHEVENRRVVSNADGELSNPQVGRPRPEETPVKRYEEHDFLNTAPVVVSHRADVLTDVTLTTNEQVLADDTCPEKPQTTVLESQVVWAPTPMPFTVAGAAFAATGAAAIEPTLRLYERTIRTATYRCGTLVRERSEKWGWLNPLAARQRWDAGTSAWVLLDGVYTDDNDTGAQGPAYQELQERWGPMELIITDHYYMQVSYVAAFDPLDSEASWLSGQYTVSLEDGRWAGPFAGVYLGSRTRTWAYEFVRHAIRERDTSAAPPFDPFDDLTPGADLKIIGAEGFATLVNLPFGLEGALATKAVGSPSRGAWLMPVAETLRLMRANELGYTERETVIERGWGHKPVGVGSYLYGDGSQAEEIQDTWQEVSRLETIYLPNGEAAHKVLITRSEFGRTVRSDEKDGVGWPPAVPRLEGSEVNTDAYTDAEEADATASPARRSETRQVKVQVLAPGLLETHFDGILKTDIPWAENEEELLAVAFAMIEESAAADVSFDLLGAFHLREAEVIHATYRPLGLAHAMRVKTVTHAGPARGPVVTNVSAVVYGW